LGSRDVIGHVTIPLPGVDFLWVVHNDHAFIWQRYGNMAPKILDAWMWTRKERWKKGKRMRKGRRRKRKEKVQRENERKGEKEKKWKVKRKKGNEKKE